MAARESKGEIKCVWDRQRLGERDATGDAASADLVLSPPYSHRHIGMY